MSKELKASGGIWEAIHKDIQPPPQVDDPGYFDIVGTILEGTDGTVADTLNRHHCIAPEEDEANANLFAASKDLFNALERIIAELPSNKDWLDPVLEAEARDALKKARGQS